MVLFLWIWSLKMKANRAIKDDVSMPNTLIIIIMSTIIETMSTRLPTNVRIERFTSRFSMISLTIFTALRVIQRPTYHIRRTFTSLTPNDITKAVTACVNCSIETPDSAATASETFDACSAATAPINIRKFNNIVQIVINYTIYFKISVCNDMHDRRARQASSN